MGRKVAIPKYGCHKATGQAVVYVKRKPVYLGLHDTPESLAEYARIVGELITAKPATPLKINRKQSLSLSVLAREWLRHLVDTGKKDAYKSTNYALDTFLPLFGETDSSEFGVLDFEQWRQSIINNGSRQEKRKGKNLSASYTNKLSRQIINMLEWASVRDLFSAEAFLKIEKIESITDNHRGINPKQERSVVSQKNFDATIAVVSPPIAAILLLLWITGARPDEITIMRPCDLDKSDKKFWVYKFNQHKTRWRTATAKTIVLNAKAQKILKPWLAECPSDTDYVFSPERLIGKYHIVRGGKHYTDHGLYTAVRRACELAGVDHWFTSL